MNKIIFIREKYGLSIFNLKIIALICMSLDHIHYYLKTVYPIPFYFNVIGRIAAPLFFFALSEGFYHTRSKFNFLKRLYIAAVLMAYFNYFIQRCIKPVNNVVIVNRMFGTMFLIGWFIYFMDMLILKIKTRKRLEAFFAISMLIIPLIWSVTVVVLIVNKNLIENPLFFNIITKAMILFPDIITTEGSIFCVTLGICFYYFRKYNLGSEIVLFTSSFILFLLAIKSGFTFENLIVNNNNFLFILALPFIYMYNGKKGRSLKYFFYLYYPLHAYFLYILLNILSR